MKKISLYIISVLALTGCIHKAQKTKDQLLLEDTIRAHVYYNKGLEHNLKLENEKALAYYDSAIAIIKEGKFFTNRGCTKIELGDSNGALMDLFRALKLDSLNYMALRNIGAIYHDKKEYKKALEYYCKSFAIEKRQNLHPTIGYLYYALGNYKEAITYFEAHLKSKYPYSPGEALFYIGNSYKALGEKEKAKAFLEKADSIGFDNRVLEDAIQ